MKITLRPVYKDTISSIHELYELLRERSTENDPHINISHRELPPFSKHARFVRSKPYHAWYLVRVNRTTAGSLNITKLNEIGIVLSKRFRGRGIGRAALEMLLERNKPLPAIAGKRVGSFLANINPKNSRSIKLFEKAGFVLKQYTFQLER